MGNLYSFEMSKFLKERQVGSKETVLSSQRRLRPSEVLRNQVLPSTVQSSEGKKFMFGWKKSSNEGALEDPERRKERSSFLGLIRRENLEFSRNH